MPPLYRSGEKLKNERDGLVHDYTRRRGVVFSAVLLPEHASREFYNREVLWNSVEKIEKSSVSQLARETEFALPREFDRVTQIRLVKEHVQEHFINKGMCADITLHDMGSGNPHAHVLLTMRPIDFNGDWGLKSKREYLLDKSGQKIPLANGDFKTRKVNFTDWDDRDNAGRWHKAWAERCNLEFEKQGLERRVTNLSYKDQGLTQEPTQHIGVNAHQLEKKGVRTKLGDRNREIMERNAERSELEQSIEQARKQVKSDENELKLIAVNEQQAVETKQLQDEKYERLEIVNKTSNVNRPENVGETVTIEPGKGPQVLYTAPEIAEKTTHEVIGQHGDTATDQPQAVKIAASGMPTKEDREHSNKIYVSEPTERAIILSEPTTDEIKQEYIEISVEIKRQSQLASEIDYNIRLLDSMYEGIAEAVETVRIYDEGIERYRQEKKELSIFSLTAHGQLDGKIEKLENSKRQTVQHLQREFDVENLNRVNSKFKEISEQRNAEKMNREKLPDLKELTLRQKELEENYVREYMKDGDSLNQAEQHDDGKQKKKYSALERMTVREAEDRLKKLTGPKQSQDRDRKIEQKLELRI